MDALSRFGKVKVSSDLKADPEKRARSLKRGLSAQWFERLKNPTGLLETLASRAIVRVCFPANLPPIEKLFYREDILREKESSMNGNGWSSRKVLLLGLLVTLLVACSHEPRITGQVSDEFGKPVFGATVQIQGTTLGGSTDIVGKYSVPYVPGNITVDIQKQGFTSAHFSLNVATPMQYPAAPVTLIPIPPPGFYLFGRSDYHSLYYPASITARPVESVKPMTLTLYADSNVKDEEYSLSPSGSAAPTFPSGHLKFVDSVNLDTNFFKLVRVGENGRILYRKRVMEERVKDFMSVIPEQIRTVDQVLIREADLEPGHYAYVAFIPQKVNWLQTLPTPLETGYEFWVK